MVAAARSITAVTVSVVRSIFLPLSRRGADAGLTFGLSALFIFCSLLPVPLVSLKMLRARVVGQALQGAGELTRRRGGWTCRRRGSVEGPRAEHQVRDEELLWELEMSALGF